VPDSRRHGKYFTRFDEESVDELQAIARAVATRVAPAVVSHLVQTRGYVPHFLDGTAIEDDRDRGQREARPGARRRLLAIFSQSVVENPPRNG